MCYEATSTFDSTKFYNTVNDLINVPCLKRNAANTIIRAIEGLKRYKPGYEGLRPEGEDELLETLGLKEMGKPITQEALDFWEHTTEMRDNYILIYDQEGRIVYHGPISTKVIADTMSMKAIDLRDEEGLFYALNVNL